MCGKLQDHFFTHIHYYHEDLSCDLLELLYAQSHADGHPLTSFENPPSILECPTRFENVSNSLEVALHYGISLIAYFDFSHP